MESKWKDSSHQMKMGIVLSYISIAVNMIIQLMYTPLLIRMLGQNEYGLYTLVASVVNYLSLFSLGFGGAYLRFYTRFNSNGDKDGIAKLNGMFLSLFLILAGIAMSVGMSLSAYPEFVFGSKLTAAELQKAEVLMRILVINVSLTLPNAVFDSIITANERFIFQKTLILISYICNPFICLPLLLMGFDSIAVVVVTTGITIGKLCLNIYYCLKKLKQKFVFCGFDFLLLKEIFSFSFFLFLNMIIDQVNWSVDNFILGRVAGTAAVAVYGVAANINTLYISFSTVISNVFAPRINKIVFQERDTRAESLTIYFIKVGRLQLMVLGLLVSGIIFFGEYFITSIYLTENYREAYWVALFLIVPVTIPLIQNLGIEIQRAMNKHQFRSIIYIIMAVLNVLISIPLAIHFGPIGSAIGTAIGLLFANGLIMNIYYHKVLCINMIAFWKSILHMAKGFILPLIVGCIIIHFQLVHTIGSFILYVCMYMIVYAVSFYMVGMNMDEKKLIRRMIKRLSWRKE